MSTQTRNPRRLPGQSVRNEEHRAIAQIGFAVVDDQTLTTQALNSVRRTVTEVVFPRTFVANGDGLEDRCATPFHGGEMFLLQLPRKLIESLRAAFQEDVVTFGQRADIREMGCYDYGGADTKRTGSAPP